MEPISALSHPGHSTGNVEEPNFGRPLVKAMEPLLVTYHEPVVVKHVLDFQGQGETDDKWVPRLAAEDWIVISCDRGKQFGGPKLPALCQHFKVTHVLVSGTLHGKKQFEKARAVITVWPELVKLTTAVKGTRFSLRMGPSVNAILVELNADGKQVVRRSKNSGTAKVSEQVGGNT